MMMKKQSSDIDKTEPLVILSKRKIELQFVRGENDDGESERVQQHSKVMQSEGIEYGWVDE